MIGYRKAQNHHSVPAKTKITLHSFLLPQSYYSPEEQIMNKDRLNIIMNWEQLAMIIQFHERIHN